MKMTYECRQLTKPANGGNEFAEFVLVRGDPPVYATVAGAKSPFVRLFNLDNGDGRWKLGDVLEVTVSGLGHELPLSGYSHTGRGQVIS